MTKLSVNVDHVATIRQARRTVEPDPVWAAALCELAGADGITVHLREDRRHIQDRDVEILRRTVRSKLNLEMSVNEQIVAVAERIAPDQATIVPEHREEVTTEGGLDVTGNRERIRDVVARLKAKGIVVSLFVDPDPTQLDAAKDSGADTVELHTGRYAAVKSGQAREAELAALTRAGEQARDSGLGLNAGHGLTVWNVAPVAAIEGMEELNIGHSIVARAVFVGLTEAVREMKEIIVRASAAR